MGCASSSAVKVGVSSKSAKSRIDEIAAAVSEHAGCEDWRAKLAGLLECGVSMSEEMGKLVEAGGKNLDDMRRIERVSEDVLRALKATLTAEVLRNAEGDEAITLCMDVAMEIDKVRASNATAALDAHINQIENEQAAAHLELIRTTLAHPEFATKPSILAPGSRRVIDAIKACNEAVPKNPGITDQLLRGIIDLAKKIVEGKQVWLADPNGCMKVKDISMEVDEVAIKLVLVMDSAWDPPFAPQVERLAKRQAEKLCREYVAAVEQETSCQTSLKHLMAVLPWWPYLRDSDMEVVSAWSKVQSMVLQEYLKHLDNPTATDAIQKFAQDFDEKRDKFEGMPPPAGGKLFPQLQVNAAKATAEKQMAVLEAHVAKEEDYDSEKIKLATSTCLQALESLVSVWSTVLESEPAFAERAEKICDALDSWALSLASSSAVGLDMVDILSKFAREYDGRRGQLVPPEVKSGPLQARVAEFAAETALASVEAELEKVEKGESLNPNKVTDSLTSTAKALASLPSDHERYEELKAREAAAFGTTEKRIRKSFTEAVVEGGSRKCEMLLPFATHLKEAKEIAGIPRTGAEGLAATLREELEAGKPVAARLQQARTETLKARGANPTVVLQTLKDLGGIWEPVSGSEPFRKLLFDIIARFKAKLTDACERSGQVTDWDKRRESSKKLYGMAAAADIAVEALKGPDGEALAAGFRPVVALALADGLLKAVEAEIQKATINNQLVLKSMQDLGQVWKEAHEADAALESSLGLSGRLEPIMRLIEERMTKSMEEGVAANQVAKQKALLDYAGLFEAAYNKVAGEGRCGLKASLQGLLPAEAAPAEAAPAEAAPAEAAPAEAAPAEAAPAEAAPAEALPTETIYPAEPAPTATIYPAEDAAPAEAAPAEAPEGEGGPAEN